MPDILMNHEEGRLRAFWRLLLQAVFFFTGVTIVSTILGFLVILVMTGANGSMPGPQAILEAMNHPLLRLAVAVISLLLAWLSLWVAARWLDKRPFRDYGFHFRPSWWLDFGFGLFLGIFLMALIFLVELSAGWVTVRGYLQSDIRGVPFWLGIAGFIIVFLCVGIYEEMVFRGYLLHNMAEGLNFKLLSPRTALLLAYLISASIFGMAHIINPNASLISTVNIIVAGLFLGLGYVLTGELAIPIGLHITWNFFQGNVFGFPVSGSVSGVSFIAIQQAGPDAWTGGAFGPEAGLIGLAAIALGSILIILWVRYRHGHAGLDESLAVYKPGVDRFAGRQNTPLPAKPE